MNWIIQRLREPTVERRNATAEIVGAGDYIGAENREESLPRKDLQLEPLIEEKSRRLKR